MSMRNEIRELADHYEQQQKALTAEMVVEASKDAERFPHLNKHIWQEAEDTLLKEARIARAHKLLISVKITTEEGTTTRLMVHTPGLVGYRSYTHVATTFDLASVKLRQLIDDVSRARARLKEFRAVVPSEVIDDIDAHYEAAEKRASEAISKRKPAETVAA